MTGRDRHALSSIRRDDVPMLVAFLRGYLHEDFAAVHGIPTRAFDAFWTDAASLERQRFLKDWERFLRAGEGARWSEVRAALEALGASWTPPTRQAFTDLERAVAAKRGGSRRSRPLL
jgi:hypothetical protein